MGLSRLRATVLLSGSHYACMVSLYRSPRRLILTRRWHSGLPCNARVRMRRRPVGVYLQKYLRWTLSFMEGSLGPPITNPYGLPMTTRRYSALCEDVGNPVTLRPICSSALVAGRLGTGCGTHPLRQIHTKSRLGELHRESFLFVREADLAASVDIGIYTRGQSSTRPVSHITCPTVCVK